jgi:hypothetical protein
MPAMSGLERVLAANRAEIEKELQAAQDELRDLREQVAVLERLIARGQAALGLGSEVDETADLVPPEVSVRATLHEVMLGILRKSGNRGMTAKELADAVNASGLYRKRDGTPVDVAQIYARIHNYGRLFTRSGNGIMAKDS